MIINYKITFLCEDMYLEQNHEEVEMIQNSELVVSIPALPCGHLFYAWLTFLVRMHLQELLPMSYRLPRDHSRFNPSLFWSLISPAFFEKAFN